MGCTIFELNSTNVFMRNKHTHTRSEWKTRKRNEIKMFALDVIICSHRRIISMFDVYSCMCLVYMMWCDVLYHNLSHVLCVRCAWSIFRYSLWCRFYLIIELLNWDLLFFIPWIIAIYGLWWAWDVCFPTISVKIGYEYVIYFVFSISAQTHIAQMMQLKFFSSSIWGPKNWRLDFIVN